MGVKVIPLLPSKNNSLIVNNKIDREKGIFKPNINIRGSIN